MALATRITYAAASAMCDALVDSLDTGGAGTVYVYPGTQPTHGGDATGETALVTFALAATAFGSASNGAASMAGGTKTNTATATGTATWFRAKNGAGTTIIDGSVGTSGCDATIDNTSISTGQTVNLTAWTVTMPRE